MYCKGVSTLRVCVQKRCSLEALTLARPLRRVNGLRFLKNAMSEVAYRKDFVRSIVRLSPPDLLYGSSREMVRYDQMCETVSGRFVGHITVGARVLGLYGTTGIGKPTLSKALCDFFDGEFSGRVCLVNLGETPRLKRVKLILERLCGFDKDVLGRITDVDQVMQYALSIRNIFVESIVCFRASDCGDARYLISSNNYQVSHEEFLKIVIL